MENKWAIMLAENVTGVFVIRIFLLVFANFSGTPIRYIYHKHTETQLLLRIDQGNQRTGFWQKSYSENA